MPKALLDEKGVLIGHSDEGDIECGDLPCNGMYRYVDGRFIPRGHGMGKPARDQISLDMAVYLLMRSVINGEPVPQECEQWCAWYKATHIDGRR